MKIAVKMSGFKELSASLGATNVLARVRLAKQVDRSSANVLAGARARVPVGTPDEPDAHPGELKKSLRRKVSSSGMSATVMAGNGQMMRKGQAARSRKRQALGVGQGPNEGKGIYAPAIEFGSQDKPAQPFLFPALNAEAQAFVDGCGDALNEALGDAMQKGAP